MRSSIYSSWSRYQLGINHEHAYQEVNRGGEDVTTLVESVGSSQNPGADTAFVKVQEGLLVGRFLDRLHVLRRLGEPYLSRGRWNEWIQLGGRAAFRAPRGKLWESLVLGLRMCYLNS